MAELAKFVGKWKKIGQDHYLTVHMTERGNFMAYETTTKGTISVRATFNPAGHMLVNTVSYILYLRLVESSGVILLYESEESVWRRC